LKVIGFWPEPGVGWPARRRERLDAELARMARFTGVETVTWSARYSG
ncbi:MAG: winged helix-turn-helix domain-containing protein, partial [Pseudomonadota bacterium]